VEGVGAVSTVASPIIVEGRGWGAVFVSSTEDLPRGSETPIEVDVNLDERLPAPVEAAAYYIASEALTNVAKHAQANVVKLTAAHDDGVLTLEVRDDGVGGVAAKRGSGILGLTDRVEALGGRFTLASPPGRGTTISVELPIATSATP